MTVTATETRMMLLDGVLKLESGDFGGAMSAVWDRMKNRGPHYGHESMTCHEYVLAMAEDMKARGWHGPPVWVAGEPPDYLTAQEAEEWVPTLLNGHHRTMAARIAGLTEIPTTGPGVRHLRRVRVTTSLWR